MKRHIQCFLSNIILVVSCFVLVILCASIGVGLYIETVEYPEFLGNHTRNIDYVRNNTDPNDFTFIATGDVKGGTETFEGLLNFSQQDKPAFIVVLGDFVSNSDLIRHKLFAAEMTEYTDNFPMFLIPGNHDIDPNQAIKLKDFETIWGPAQFEFTVGKNLFVFLNNIPLYNENGQYLKFLEDVLSGKGKSADKIFVFMHVPPSDLNPSLICNGLAGSERFFELAKKYHIDYVIAGDHHGYVKTERDGTTYVVTGGGGSRLRGAHGRFYHVMRMDVQNGMITETVLAGEKRLETFELIERNLVVYIWPLISKSLLSIGLTIVLFVISVLLLVFSLKRRKQTAKNSLVNTKKL